MANSRGNQYSKPINWNWNWDQHAQYDLPAVVDYVLNYTKTSKLFYIGHSQGATIGFAGFQNNEKLASKIKLFVALAPVTYLYNHRSLLIGTLTKLRPDFITKIIGNGPFVPTFNVLSKLFGSACTTTPFLCNNVLYSLYGEDNLLNNSRLSIYTSHYPDITSSQNLLHWLQNANSGEFRMYNNGSFYDPSLVGCPTAIFYGSLDPFANSIDIENLIKKAGTFITFKKKIEGFSHMSFVWSMNAKTVLFPNIVNLLNIN